MNEIKELINRIKRYIRYLRICNALKIKLFPWQKDFVLDNKPIPEYYMGRGTGKTITILIKLMLDTDYYTTKSEAIRILMNDKDFVLTHKGLATEYQKKYDSMRDRCIKKGIKISKIDFIGLNEPRDW